MNEELLEAARRFFLPLEEVIALARARSPYYRRRFAEVPAGSALSALPITTARDLAENSDLKTGTMATGPVRDALYFESSGTTGKAKCSLFGREEWRVYGRLGAHGIIEAGLREGDRVANLTTSGPLWAAYPFTHSALLAVPFPIMMYEISSQPFAEAGHLKEQVAHLSRLEPNALLGVPTRLVALAGLIQSGEFGPRAAPFVEKIFFLGEHFYADQVALMKAAFPNAVLRSYGHSSADSGTIGYADDSCQAQGEHRVHPGTVVEVLDQDTLEPITEAGQPGLLVVTSQVRRLMPIIRYAVGDVAQWTEPARAQRRYQLLGRSNSAVALGLHSFHFEEVRQAVDACRLPVPVLGLQVVLERLDGKDRLTVRVAVQDPQAPALQPMRAALAQRMMDVAPELRQEIDSGFAHRIEAEFINLKDLFPNPRTGKMLPVVDRRFPAR